MQGPTVVIHGQPTNGEAVLDLSTPHMGQVVWEEPGEDVLVWVEELRNALYFPALSLEWIDEAYE